MHNWRLHRFRQTLRVKQHFSRMMRMVQVHIHGHVIDRRLVDAAIDVIECRLMRELLRRKRRLLVHVERVEIRERLLNMLRHMRIVPLECSALMASMQGAFGRGKRQRSAQSHSKARSVQVASLVVVQCAGTSRRWRIIAGNLVGEHVETLAVRIHHGRCETRCAKGPLLVRVSLCGVRILEIVRLSV